MKKFLFTLVALLSAGCMFAQDYLFFDDIDLRGETDGELILQGHFEFAPQAFQIEFTSLPDGMTIVDSEVGADSKISYKNASGRNKVSAPLWLNEGLNYMCAQAELEYYQVDGAGDWVSAGPVNWLPGDYEELAIFYVELDETFVGGTVEFDVAIDYGDPSDPDPRADEYPWHTGIRHSGSFSVGETAVTPQTDAPTIDVVTNEDGTVTVTVTGEGTLNVLIEGYDLEDDVITYTGASPYEITLQQADEAQEVTVSATAQKEGELESDPTVKTFEIEAKPVPPAQTDAPTIDVVTNEDGTVTVTVTGEGTLNVLIEGYDLELDVITYTGPSPYTITLQQAEEAQEVTVSATAQKENELESDPAVKTFEIEALTPPTPQLLTGEIQFSEVDQDNGQFTVTYTGDEEGVVITLNDETILPVRGTTNKYQLPTYGEYPVVATATAPGYENQVTGEATLVWNEPVTPVTPPTAPQITIDTEAGAIVVGATEQEGATTTLYQVTYDDEGNEILTPIENPTAFPRTDANYTVWVKAIAVNEAGEAESTVTEVVVPAAASTGIDEMMGGKTISNVRYFNMAGQEMQEANGMTIVVTTYTDGTQTAVKVMK